MPRDQSARLSGHGLINESPLGEKTSAVKAYLRCATLDQQPWRSRADEQAARDLISNREAEVQQRMGDSFMEEQARHRDRAARGGAYLDEAATGLRALLNQLEEDELDSGPGELGQERRSHLGLAPCPRRRRRSAGQRHCQPNPSLLLREDQTASS